MSKPVWLVDVAVPVPLRLTFSYRVPADMAPTEVKAGHRVLVPFRAKLLYGVTLTDAYLDHEPERTYRSFAGYDARTRVLSPEIHKLVDWIVRYYKAPVGEAIKLAMPPGLLSEKEVRFRLTATGERAVETGIIPHDAKHSASTGSADDLSDETHLQLNLVEQPAGEGKAVSTEKARTQLPQPLTVLSGRALSKKAWERRAGCKLPFKDIRAWEDAGWLSFEPEGGESESVPHVEAVRLTPVGHNYDLADLGRAKKQVALVAWLRERSRDVIPQAEISQAFKGSSRLLHLLAERGLIERVRVPKHEVERLQDAVEPDDIKVLTDEQAAALTALRDGLEKSQFAAFLMFGVTGAGKTEVYLRAVQDCLSRGRQALFLVPEIALTPLMQRRIVDRFGERLAILHSAVGLGRRKEAWARVLAGKVDVVLGARSGIFAPLPRLGLVVVDEEHDPSYKQNDGIRYHARDLALLRAKLAGAVAVLGSATPSLETWRNMARGRAHLLELKYRATKAKLPAVDIVDMREEFQRQRRRPILSEQLAVRMREELIAGRQVMILLNRRGYHNFLLCRKCGYSMACSQCDVCLTYHRTDNLLRCHYCGEHKSVPENCPDCGADGNKMQFFGEGTQQIESLIQEQFEDYVVDRLDRDRLTKLDEHTRILAKFERGETHILVGTQMIAKGHDFPNVTLVGILNADMGLKIPDFRAAELTFQLLTQVAGRSGRGDRPGSVVIQTYSPEHYTIQAAANHDFLAFLKKETRFRQGMFYPPYAHMAAILVTHEDVALAHQVTAWMAEQLKRLQARAKLVILGPAKAPIGKIKGAHRFQIVLKSEDRSGLHAVADAVVEAVVERKMLPRPAIILDIDPHQFF